MTTTTFNFDDNAVDAFMRGMEAYQETGYMSIEERDRAMDQYGPEFMQGWEAAQRA